MQNWQNNRAGRNVLQSRKGRLHVKLKTTDTLNDTSTFETYYCRATISEGTHRSRGREFKHRSRQHTSRTSHKPAANLKTQIGGLFLSIENPATNTLDDDDSSALSVCIWLHTLSQANAHPADNRTGGSGSSSTHNRARVRCPTGTPSETVGGTCFTARLLPVPGGSVFNHGLL